MFCMLVWSSVCGMLVWSSVCGMVVYLPLTLQQAFAEGKNEVLREGGRELVRKAFLMSAHTMKCAENIQVVKEFTTRIVSRPQLFR